MDGQISTTRRRGRPPRYLLSAIAVCGVCGAATRVGAQNTGGGKHQPSHYRVYECAGAPGRTGFHVSMRQEHLDEIVTDAVLARILGPDFRVPRAREEDEDGSERRALRLEIKGHRAWLEAVRKEARRRGRPRVLAAQERIVRLKIEAAQARIDELERLNPLVDE
ncbi:zinc ribbon domain-containing protein, partial [Neisseria gonorrhoeae]